MKNIFLLSLLTLIVFSTGCLKKTDKEISDKEMAELRTAANDFMKSLKAVLVNEIRVNGIVSAVSVCSDTAQMLTNNFGHETGVYIKRVSFRNRNPLNKPDEFEADYLQKFEELFRNGELFPQTEFAEIEEADGQKFIHYMKPILVQSECLGCHGMENEIPESVKAVLNEKYPEDKAVNFRTGDLRGAVSVKKIIEQK
jgi:hypothetical protein